MHEIRPWLYIGNYSDTQNRNYLEFKSIQAMLQLAAPVRQIGITSHYLQVTDMSPIPHDLIKQGVDFVLEEKGKEHKILVACAAGINRSTAFCIATLKETEGLSLLDAFKEIKRKHSESLPHESVWESLCSYYNEAIPYIDVMRVKI
ncbi:MAG: dual specificity protein phosphatase family protein [Anaerolineales bacterium]|nr:dual specificity protein phosphatase family protein [Anaerolineales bacterium]